jgi:hypothetical protein
VVVGIQPSSMQVAAEEDCRSQRRVSLLFLPLMESVPTHSRSQRACAVASAQRMLTAVVGSSASKRAGTRFALLGDGVWSGQVGPLSVVERESATPADRCVKIRRESASVLGLWTKRDRRLSRFQLQNSKGVVGSDQGEALAVIDRPISSTARSDRRCLLSSLLLFRSVRSSSTPTRAAREVRA